MGTGNKVEDFGIGFYTKYGDGGVDVSPIADLLKSEVFLMGKNLCNKLNFKLHLQMDCGMTTELMKTKLGQLMKNLSGQWHSREILMI